MKRLVLLSVLGVVLIAGCGATKCCPGSADKQEKAITTVRSLYEKPQEYAGKKVTLSGVVDSQCNTGCWFNLKDDTGVVYVDLKPSGLAIPQSKGKKVTVNGVMQQKHGKVMVVGEGVDIK